MRVAVVGLGIAGMRTAMLLERRGVEVELFEARDRLGGRLETTDQGQGAVYESGGEWIDSDHERCLNLISELGLNLLDAPGGPRHYVFQGERCTSESLWPEVLEDELRFEGTAREMCRQLNLPPWLNTELVGLDNANLSTLIDQTAQTPKGRWFLTAQALSDEGSDPDQIGLLGWLSFYLYYLQRQGGEMSAYRIEGGAGALMKAMAEGLKAAPRLNMELVRTSQHENGVVLAFSDETIVEADRVVLCIPPRPLERIIFEPALSPDKRCAIEACRMGPMIKICLEFDVAWWEEDGWNGSMQCDLAIQQTWNGSRSSAPILTCYICGRAAEALAKDPEAVVKAVDELSSLYPKARTHFLRGWVHDWIHDPYAGGGFSNIAPGYVLQHMAHIAPPERRIHFAGEHTSTWTGFIEGALESAGRVVEEILN